MNAFGVDLHELYDVPDQFRNRGTKYCVAFGGAAGGKITDKGATSFKVTNPTAEGCSP